MNYKEQIGVITYPKNGSNRSAFVLFHVSAARAAGRVVVFCDGFARIHVA